MTQEKEVKQKSWKNVFKGDKGIWMIFFFLCMISVVEVYSASSSLTYKGGNFMWPMFYHLSILLMGFGGMLVVMNIDCRYFKLISPFYLFIAIVLLYIVLLVGSVTNGASRWISIFGIQFQPSELGKGALVLVVAQILSAMQRDTGADKKAFKWIFWISLAVILPILKENLSTAVLLFITIFFMMIIGRVPWSQLGKLLGVLGIGVVIGFFAIMLLGNADKADDEASKQNLTEQTVKAPEEKEETSVFGKIFHRFDTWKARLENFGKDDVPAKDYDLLNKDAQPGHASIAIASSNIVGKGPGNSTERDYLSQAFSDFIYAIIIEEFGFGGAVAVVALYLLLFLRVASIAKRLENPFPIFFAMGLTFMLVSQALFNMAVAVGLIPVTGQPLPLISKGGTSSVINCMYIGVLLSISRSAKRKKKDNEETPADAAMIESEV